MKKNILLIFAIVFCFTTNAQNGKTKKLLKKIENEWSIDDNGNVSYVSVIESPKLSKTEIYNRASNYFVYNYGSGKSVIQTEDKELGRIVGKGLYKDVHIGISLITMYVDCWHILRIDCKEGRARIILTLTEYEKKIVGGDGPPAYFTMRVENEFPINNKGGSKTIMGKSFYKSHNAALATIDAITKAINQGNTSSGFENEDW